MSTGRTQRTARKLDDTPDSDTNGACLSPSWFCVNMRQHASTKWYKPMIIQGLDVDQHRQQPAWNVRAHGFDGEKQS